MNPHSFHLAAACVFLSVHPDHAAPRTGGGYSIDAESIGGGTRVTGGVYTNDDFGSFTGDGLPDNWQVQWCGLNNPNAAPTADGTGQNNLFKRLAGLDPLNRAVFAVAASPVPGQPGKMWFAFSPPVSGRSDTVRFNDTLRPGTRQPLTGYSPVDIGAMRTITDHAAPGEHRCYRVQITTP
ncbi:MAG: hypothetical protein NTW21_10380 [Verrucomicrobia bacterium]|nr:hypothetical protein [Verrucomicrobiota bacterium]